MSRIILASNFPSNLHPCFSTSVMAGIVPRCFHASLALMAGIRPRCFSMSHVRAVGLGPCGVKPDYGPLDIGRCTLMNGIKLVSAHPHGAQIAACSILYQCGSRFECDDTLGVVHFLRTCSSASGGAYSSFSKTRVLQQLGCYVSVNSDRQSVVFTLRCPVHAFQDVKHYLLDIAARSTFAQHEVDERKAQVKLDLHTVHPETLLLDLVQKACWGGGLNNSVYCEKARIDSMSSKDMDQFAALHMRSDECTIGTYGLPFEDLMVFAEMIEPNRSREMEVLLDACIQMPSEEVTLLNEKTDFKLELPTKPRCYPPSFPRAGFEYHDLGRGSDTWIAVGIPSCGNCDPRLLMTHSIVAAACGTGYLTRGKHYDHGVVELPLGQYVTDANTMYKAFNISYADTGVFGIIAKCRSCAARQVAFTAVSFLRNLHSLTAEQFYIGKRRLKIGISVNDDNCVNYTEGLALQAACNVKLDNAYDSFGMLETISMEELGSVARCLADKCKCMAVAVVGDVSEAAHTKELLQCC